MKKILLLSVIALLVAIAIYRWRKESNANRSTLAIVTTLSHPALEAVRDGSIETIKKENPEVDILDFNA
jgi:ABC-type uncharacterized transport system substrate-binding protein